MDHRTFMREAKKMRQVMLEQHRERYRKQWGDANSPRNVKRQVNGAMSVIHHVLRHVVAGKSSKSFGKELLTALVKVAALCPPDFKPVPLDTILNGKSWQPRKQRAKKQE